MKKISVLFIIFLLCLGFISCMEQEGETDEDKILERIEDLQAAINSDNHTNFMKCMHSDSNQYLSYTETSFNTQFSGVIYSF